MVFILEQLQLLVFSGKVKIFATGSCTSYHSHQSPICFSTCSLESVLTPLQPAVGPYHGPFVYTVSH